MSGLPFAKMLIINLGMARVMVPVVKICYEENKNRMKCSSKAAPDWQIVMPLPGFVAGMCHS
jgi:hypothetical protein